MISKNLFFYVSQTVNDTQSPRKRDSHKKSQLQTLNTIVKINEKQKISNSSPLNNFHRKIDGKKENVYDRIDFSPIHLIRTFIVVILYIK